MQIETDIPIPPADSRRKGQPCIVPFDKMEIGNSVFVPASVRSIASCRAMANQAGDRLKRRFTCQKVTHEGQLGLRIWRFA
jgi:hypothetical protein